MMGYPKTTLVLTSWFTLLIPVIADAEVVVTDPAGDTFGSNLIQHDIVSMTAKSTDTDLTLIIGFYNNITAPSAHLDNGLFGFIDFDLDQDKTTGAQSNITQFGNSAISG